MADRNAATKTSAPQKVRSFKLLGGCDAVKSTPRRGEK
jgi:hypothetical protein